MKRTLTDRQNIYPLDPYLQVLDIIPDTFGFIPFMPKKPIYIGKRSFTGACDITLSTSKNR